MHEIKIKVMEKIPLKYIEKHKYLFNRFERLEHWTVNFDLVTDIEHKFENKSRICGFGFFCIFT